MSEKKDPAALKPMFESQMSGAKTFRSKFGRMDRYRSYLQILAHNYYANDNIEADSPTVNIIASRVRSIPPQLAFGIPNFELEPLVPPPTPNSPAANAAWLALTWRTEGIDERVREVTLDWPTFGLGIGFVAFEKGQEGEILDQKRKLFGMLSPEFTGSLGKLPGMKKVVDAMSVREQQSLKLMLRQRAFMDRTSLLDFLIDPCAKRWDDAVFMARRLYLPKVKALAMFGADCPDADSIGNVAVYKEDTGPEGWNDTDKTSLSKDMPDAVKRVEVWEMWHIEQRKTIYLNAKGKVIGDHIYDWRHPHPGFPFVPLTWDVIPDVLFPEGLSASLKSLQDELHIMRKRRLQEASKAIGLYRVPKRKLNEFKRWFAAAKDGGLVPMEDDDIIEPIQRTPMPAEFWQLDNEIRKDMDEVSHTSPYMAAGQPQVRQTAMQVSVTQSGADAMLAYRQLQLERFASEVAERLCAIAWATFDEPIPLLIKNEDPDYIDPQTGQAVPVGTEITFPFIPIEHAGYYTFKTTEGSMAASARDVERQQLSMAFQMFSAFPWFKAKEAAIHYYSLMPSVKDPAQFVKSVEDMAREQAEAAAQQPPPAEGQQLLSSMQQGGIMPPPVDSSGSGLPAADIMAGVMGGQAPMTGNNGMGGLN